MQKVLSGVLMACLWGFAAAAVTAVEVAHYTFETNADDSATGDGTQNLQLLGEATITTPGIVGDGLLSLNGNTANYAIASGTNEFTSGVPAITLSAWFTTTNIIIGNTQQILMQMPITGGATLGQSAVALEISSGRLQMGGRSSTADSYQFIDATKPEENPFDLMSDTTYFGATVIDYVNNTVTGYLYNPTAPAGEEWKSTSKTVAFANTSGPGNLGLYVGRRGDPTRPFNGGMDEARIFTHALTEAELQEMAGYEAPPTSNGDFDEDGDVDGHDFLMWQRGESPSALSAEDLSLWAENYGTVPELASVAAVPEPASVSLVLTLGMAMTMGRRR